MLYVATLNVATGFSVTFVQAKSEAIMIKTGIRWLILIIVISVDCKCAYGVSLPMANGLPANCRLFRRRQSAGLYLYRHVASLWRLSAVMPAIRRGTR